MPIYHWLWQASAGHALSERGLCLSYFVLVILSKNKAEELIIINNNLEEWFRTYAFEQVRGGAYPPYDVITWQQRGEIET